MNRRRGERGPVGGPVRPPEGSDSVVAFVDALPRDRGELLAGLIALQRQLGWLPAWAIEYLAARLRVPKSEAYGVASSFPELRLSEPPAEILRICTGAACRLAGADQLLAHRPDAERADCLFICPQAPAAQLGHRLVGRCEADDLAMAVGIRQS